MEQNYLPLFRKYRPQSFKDIVGQESLVKALTNAIELGRIANAYLFCGPRGTGKTSSARIFAKSLNCEHGPTLEPCQKCASCTDITNATGLDVIEIDAASNRGIQDAKDLIAQTKYAPINGKYKIFIIDEVHMLSKDAFNALLKTFEEPPENVIFILATTEPNKVLETIVSRCQRFDLRRITTQDIIKRLRYISDLENIKITDDALFTIAKNVSGGLRDSLALLDQVSILGVKEEINKELIEEVLGKINFDTLLDLLESINNEDIVSTVQKINDIYNKGNEPRNLAENFISFLRNILLVLNSTNYEAISSFSSFIKEDIDKINACNFDKDKTIKILNSIIKLYPEIKNSTNPYLWMEIASINACKINLLNTNIVQNASAQPISKPQAAMNIQAPIQQVAKAKAPQVQATQQIQQTQNIEIKEEIKPQVEIQPVQTEQTQHVNPPTNSNIMQSQDSAEIWLTIVEKITNPIAKAMFKGTVKFLGIKDSVITLGYANEGAYKQVQSRLPQLETAMNTTYPNLKVAFEKITAETKIIEIKSRPNFAPQNYNQELRQQQNLNQQVQINNQNDLSQQQEEQIPQTDQNEKKHYSPQVQDMIEQFNGRIID